MTARFESTAYPNIHTFVIDYLCLPHFIYFEQSITVVISIFLNRLCQQRKLFYGYLNLNYLHHCFKHKIPLGFAIVVYSMTRKELPILGNPYPSYIRQCTSHVAPNTYLIIVSLILWSNQKLRFIMTYYCILIVDRIKFKKSADYYDRLLYSYCW